MRGRRVGRPGSGARGRPASPGVPRWGARSSGASWRRRWVGAGGPGTRACGSGRRGRRLRLRRVWGPGATATGWPPPAARDPALRVGARGARVGGGSAAAAATASWRGEEGEGRQTFKAGGRGGTLS